MDIADILQNQIIESICSIYKTNIDKEIVQLQQTRKEFTGDYTLVVFPFLKISKKSPENTATEIGQYLANINNSIESFNVVKGFLNIKLSINYWLDTFKQITTNKNFGFKTPNSTGKSIMVEYSSPNTNKPLHLGHIRNNLLGYSVAQILKANGHKVYKVNLVNDRGIHICKSMLAWQKWGNQITPEQANIKGDKLVGDYYVKFDQEYKKQIAELILQGQTEDEAKENAPIINEAREMLRKWEKGDETVYNQWAKMNNWVYSGFDITYKALGVDFDKVYYESQTYKLGKTIVNEGLLSGVLFKKDDGSVWADLTNDGLDQKLLLRSDGTSVYMTQDLGTAVQRFDEFELDSHIYVVGNEQNYHFQVLKLILSKLGYSWANNISHLSYGMVELPCGKMKSREGTVVDADDLIDEMISTARQTSIELGKLDGFSQSEADNIYNIVGLGALKYFILKVDPKKTMVFNPAESIDFNGNTGPFIQYTHARIKSVLRKANELGIELNNNVGIDTKISDKEIDLIKMLANFKDIINEAGLNMSPAIIANYMYDLAKEYNQFYHEHQVIKETDTNIQMFRLLLSYNVANIIKNGMLLLGINVPERM